MKILYFALECKPFSKVGGVGDVALELPLSIKKEGVDIEIVTPLYQSVDRKWVEDKPYSSYTITFKNKKGKEQEEIVELFKSTYNDIDVTFISNSTYFEGEYGEPYVFSSHTPFYDDFIRFHFFSLAAVKVVEKKKPDIVNANDWGLGFLLGELKRVNNPAKRLFTIHNNSYQGNMWIPAIRNWSVMSFMSTKEGRASFVDPRHRWNSVNPLFLGINSADAVNTVSHTYKDEMLKKDKKRSFFFGGCSMERALKKHEKRGTFYGILNGFDYSHIKSYEETIKLKTECKKELSSKFKNSDSFLIGFVGRAVEQKFKLLQEKYLGKSILEHIAKDKRVNIGILATGLSEYEDFLKKFRDYDNISVTIAFDKDLAAKISLGCDLFLMPSLYEPCGITQMESLSNATPPLVRFVGGLKDTVHSYKKSNGTGFGFNGKSRGKVLKNLLLSVCEAVDLYYNEPEKFEATMKAGHKQRFLWSDSAKKYLQVYNNLQ